MAPEQEPKTESESELDLELGWELDLESKSEWNWKAGDRLGRENDAGAGYRKDHGPIRHRP
jgi:hypothetical protein